jgi:thioredoxin-dependent peroxiredoxin
MTPEEGTPAPAFSAIDQHGQKHSLKAYKGKPVVLYFYPRDDTPGCVKEACGFRDAQAEIKKAGAIVLGVSRDDQASHEKFAKKYDLNFPLLVDEGPISEAYGTWVEKTKYGRTYMGIQRATFLIGPDGRIAKVWPRVKPEEHPQHVLEALKALASA